MSKKEMLLKQPCPNCDGCGVYKEDIDREDECFMCKGSGLILTDLGHEVKDLIDSCINQYNKKFWHERSM